MRFWLQDITGEKTQIETHTRLWRQHRALADNSPDIIMRFGADLKCIFANRAVERILGVDPALLIGKSHKEMGFQQGETAALMDKAILKAFATGASLSEEFRVETKQGERYLSWRTVPEWSRPDKGIDSVLVIARDTTAEKEAEAKRLALEERLRESQKLEAVGTLSGGIAHDFNNILAVILGNAELALDDTSKTSPVTQNLKNLRTAALRGRDLVRQILAFSRRSAQDRKEVMITPLVKETVKLLRSTISATVDIRVEVKAEHDYVLANPGQIQQVLVNLCTNAAQAMADGGAMTISLGNVTFQTGDQLPEPGFRQSKYLVISVTDTGHGMDEATRQHIFEPFFSTRKPQGGTGLGLSVVYGIIKAHEGAVTVRSAPGKGSTFTVFLPLAESRAGTVREVRTEELKGRGRILFVDDEELVVEMAKEGLSRLGYEVRTETKPEKALKAFEENGNFDVIITDQAMPGMSGMSLAKRLLEIRPDVPIILCTGYSAGMDEKTVKAAGIREFFMKPYTRTELSEIVARVLRTPGSKKE
jgi:PAS domain S-box-containing protein